MPEKISVELTYDELSYLHGWSSFVRHSPDGVWDERDEAVRLLIYEAMLNFPNSQRFENHDASSIESDPMQAQRHGL